MFQLISGRNHYDRRLPDLAILKAEMDAGVFDREIGSVDPNVYRAQPLDPETADRIADAFKRWGIDLSLRTQTPKLWKR
jgi:hypothetical protein